MENNKRPGGKAGAMEGKGFYIVLFLCAAVIGVSAWMLLAGVGTNVENNDTAEKTVDISGATVTMLPAGAPTMAQQENKVKETATPVATPEPKKTDAEQTMTYEEVTPVFAEAVTSYVWPVQGAIEVPYAVETLIYNNTMADWRTHDGIDIACALGDEVIATAGGTVVSVSNGDLTGTTVEIDHANGVHSVYSNLASEPPVSQGDIVTMGQIIGSVGGTALGEVNEVPHLHFAMTLDGRSADPMSYLPGE